MVHGDELADQALHIKPTLRRIEHFAYGLDDFRSAGGPMIVAPAT